MTDRKMRVNLMTAGLTPGDAISNYNLALYRTFRHWGVPVNLYADHIAPQLQSLAQPSRLYEPTGRDLLWFHYSLYADNLEQALASSDRKIMDYHGICPPHLFAGQNAHLEYLCEYGYERLPGLSGQFEQYVVHSEDSRRVLTENGFQPERIHKIYYSADTTKFDNGVDEALAPLLAQVEYFVLVGRIVPQKDVLALVEVFAHIHRSRPDAFLFLIGNRDQTKQYQTQIDRLIDKHGLGNRIIFTGQVNNPAVLGALLQNAKLLFVTSEWESFCIPIAESLYFGVPVAVHDQPPMTEIAGPAGLVFDKRQPEQAAGQVLALLDDPERYVELAEQAGKWARQYTDNTLAGNVQSFLKEVLNIEV